MANEIATALAKAGHEVSVFTQFPNRPQGRIFPGFRRRFRSIERVEDFKLVRCLHWVLDRNRRIMSRVLENLTFGISSGINLILSERPDIAIIETWPLFANWILHAICHLRGIPTVNYVQDLYPEVLEQTGQIRKGGKLANLLRAWDRAICNRSSHIIAISPGMKKLICGTRNIPEDKVSSIPNWMDSNKFPVLSRQNKWREEAGVSPEQFLVLYAGTLGHVSGAGILIEIFKRLSSREDVILVCVGEGVLKAEMQASAESHGLRNVRFHSVQPVERVAEMHAAADATILTTQENFPDASVPSKLVSYLAAGRAVICSAPRTSTVAQIVKDANAGIVNEAGDVARIADAVSFLADNRDVAEHLGANARRCFEERFTFERAFSEVTTLLDQIAGMRSNDQPSERDWDKAEQIRSR
jgi:colanic acid biosynthesis glycosyl transferase WcaI